tara:strand:+ start:2200 stop:2766 length:567 start_codon:yes stop_codon:yes gene_type:complete
MIKHKPVYTITQKLISQSLQVYDNCEFGLPNNGDVAATDSRKPIIAISFSQPCNHSPIGTNIGLAWAIAEDIRQNGQRIIIAQWDVAVVLVNFFNIPVQVISWREEGSFLNTRAVANYFSNFSNFGKDVVIVTCHQHMLRAIKITECFGFNPVGSLSTLNHIPWKLFGCDENGYESAHNKSLCFLYEI